MSVDEIAKGLTWGEKRMIGRFNGEWSAAKTCSPFFASNPLLAEHRFIRVNGAYQKQYRLTELGLAVRAHLEATDGHHSSIAKS